jgi:hypothetical protein
MSLYSDANLNNLNVSRTVISQQKRTEGRLCGRYYTKGKMRELVWYFNAWISAFGLMYCTRVPIGVAVWFAALSASAGQSVATRSPNYDFDAFPPRHVSVLGIQTALEFRVLSECQEAIEQAHLALLVTGQIKSLYRDMHWSIVAGSSAWKENCAVRLRNQWLVTCCMCDFQGRTTRILDALSCFSLSRSDDRKERTPLFQPRMVGFLCPYAWLWEMWLFFSSFYNAHYICLESCAFNEI